MSDNTILSGKIAEVANGTVTKHRKMCDDVYSNFKKLLHTDLMSVRLLGTDKSIRNFFCPSGDREFTYNDFRKCPQFETLNSELEKEKIGIVEGGYGGVNTDWLRSIEASLSVNVDLKTSVPKTNIVLWSTSDL